MLVSLSIKNYALIKNISVQFYEGYSVITGETGAGKSILLGALGLVLGNRADSNVLKNQSEKCVIEAEFDIRNYNLQSVFESLEIDYEHVTIIRRELLPNGKTRAFVNDSPVSIKSLQILQTYLIDIHSQNNNQELSEKKYPFLVVDSLANTSALLTSYQEEFRNYKKAVKAYNELKSSQELSKQQYDYNLFVYNELVAANLKETTEIENLESEIEKLSNIESIKLHLSEAVGLAVADEVGLQSQLAKMMHSLSKIASYDQLYQEAFERISAIKIEFDDAVVELEDQFEKVDFEPESLTTMSDRLSLLYSLLKKHQVLSLEELINLRNNLETKIALVTDSETILKEQEAKVLQYKTSTLAVAKEITEARKKVVPHLVGQIEHILKNLGMENAQFDVAITSNEVFNDNGIDEIDFLLASNKGSEFSLLKKVASGGEMSRIMLALKTILSKVVKLPTIIFDEIDTGVSGEVATKIALLMQHMGKHMQVITISHLPQVASKGATHYKVFKQVDGDETNTYLKQLSANERIEEIAEMLSGKEKSQSALEHAQQLLQI